MLKNAKKNGDYNIEKSSCNYLNLNQEKKYFFNQKFSKKIFLGNKEQIPAIRLLIRLLATLEMIIKDPKSNISIRYGNRKDFKAALKLFEKITLPKYFGIFFENDLFIDYNNVEPYPSWEMWDNL